jgi:hypothetical protein
MTSLQQAIERVRAREGFPPRGVVSLRQLLARFSLTPALSVRALLASDFIAQRYDKQLADVISGAGNYKPGIVLDKQESSSNWMLIALMGKFYCKVDAQYGAIEVGDLLTTSPTSGHAMKVTNPLKAFGAVIRKALRSLDEGQGLVLILIALQ